MAQNSRTTRSHPAQAGTASDRAAGHARAPDRAAEKPSASGAKPAAALKPSTYYRGEDATFRLKNNLGRLLKQTYVSLNRMIDENVMPLGLTAMQWKPLVMICYQNLNTPAEIARRAMVDTGAMTRTLDRLEAKGFLTRKRCETDRRVVNVELTESGKEVVNGILPAVANAFNAHLAGFSTQEIETLFSFLDRIIDNGSCKPDSDTPEEH